MAKIKFFWDNLWDDGILTASTEATDCDAEYTQHIWHTRTWRTTAVAAQWIKADLGAAQDVKAFIIKNHNFTAGATLKIQANAIDDWAAPSVDVTLTITSDIVIKLWDAAQSYKWWRVYIDDAANTDGYIEIGRIFLGEYFQPEYNFGHRTPGYIDPSDIIESDGGQVSVNQKTHYETLAYDLPFVTTSDVALLKSVYDKLGITIPYFICEDSAAANPYLETYYVFNTGEWQFPSLAPTGTYQKGAISVRTAR